MVGALVLCAGLGCGRHAPPPPRFLQVDIENSPISTDPRFATDAISSRINELVFDSLVRVDRHGRFVGQLAESIERPGETHIVFHLKRGIRFSDGREMTARDVKYTYDTTINPSSMSPKRGGFAELKSIEAPDDRTIVMTTYRPYAPAMEMAMLEIVEEGTPLPRKSAAPAPAGTGPFRMVRYARDDSIWLERNAYRQFAPDAPMGIVFKIVPDPTVRALELAEGICDLAENNIEPEVLPYLISVPALEVNESAGTTYQYLGLNFRNPLLRDVRIRRAIAYAIDRKAIAASYLRGTARVASGMLAPENWAYDGKVAIYDYDPERARRLLEEAGFHADAGGRRDIRFVYKTTPEGGRLAETIQAMLRQVGIDVEIRSNEWATFYGDIQKGNFDLMSSRWIGINDPNHYYLVFDSSMTPPRGLNRGAYSNREMDSLLEQGATTIDPEQRRRIYARVQEIAAEDLPYISLWWIQNVVVMNRAVRNFTPYPNGSLRSLAEVKLADDRAEGASR